MHCKLLGLGLLMGGAPGLDRSRAINRISGGNALHWSVEQIVAAGDQATGTYALTTLYAEMKATPVSPDLQDLFVKLGIGERQGNIEFDEPAPLAAIRRRITAPPSDSNAEP